MGRIDGEGILGEPFEAPEWGAVGRKDVVDDVGSPIHPVADKIVSQKPL